MILPPKMTSRFFVLMAGDYKPPLRCRAMPLGLGDDSGSATPADVRQAMRGDDKEDRVAA
jgi:hypothetical protein